MRSTFPIAGMHCGACVAKITDAIRALADVDEVTVSLEDSQAVIESARALPLDEVAAAVASAGDYRVVRDDQSESDAAPSMAMASGDDAQPPESIFPLLLIVGYILGVVLLIAVATGQWAIEPMMRHFMAGFFITFSFFKLLDISGFVTAFRGYDIVAKGLPAWAWLYPFVELALGVAYLLDLMPVITNSVTLVIMLVGAVGVLQALLGRRRIRCACLGTALNLPMTTVTLVEDLTMAAMAAAMLLMMAF